MAGKAKILVVDDEHEIRSMLSRHFRFLGYEVETAENGKAALEELSKNRYDVMISDISMPVMDGVELLKAVRKEYPMVRVIMVTGYVSLENALMCMKHKADTCLFKPIEDLSLLEEAVKNSIRQLTHWQEIFKHLRSMKPKETSL